MSSREKTQWEQKKERSESDARARRELAAMVENTTSYMTQKERRLKPWGQPFHLSAVVAAR